MRQVSQRTVAAIALPIALAACGSMQRDIARQTDDAVQQVVDRHERFRSAGEPKSRDVSRNLAQPNR